MVVPLPQARAVLALHPLRSWFPMPILPSEPNRFPEGLFLDTNLVVSGRLWHVLHTRPRQEKSLARYLLHRSIPFYLPLISRRRRSGGRTLTSYVPLFSGYVFLLGDGAERLDALSTHRVARSLPVLDQPGVWRDLRQIDCLIASGAPVTPEDRLQPGMAVEIQSGPLAGLRGKIIRSASGRRFVVQVDFIQKGASALLDDYVLVKAKDDLDRG